MTWLLLACIKGSDDTATGDSSGLPDDSGTDCGVVEDGYLKNGTWAMNIAEALVNDCENEDGDGIHIHVGEDTMTDWTTDGACIDMISDPGSEQEMPWVGSTSDGSTVQLTGVLEIGFGTCVTQVTGVLDGVLLDDSTMDYTIEATFDVFEELSPDACDPQFIVWGPLPCDNAWTGRGTWVE